MAILSPDRKTIKSKSYRHGGAFVKDRLSMSNASKVCVLATSSQSYLDPKGYVGLAVEQQPASDLADLILMGIDGTIVGGGASYSHLEANALKGARIRGAGVHLAVTYNPRLNTVTFTREVASITLNLKGYFVDPNYKPSLRFYVGAAGTNSALTLQ